MPTAPPHLCNRVGCGTLTSARYCEKHTAQDVGNEQRKAYDKQRADDPLRRFYHTARWRRIRAMILRRDPVCRDPFKIGCLELSTDADHVTPVRQGGAMWNLANLQGLCASCHARKTREEHAAMRLQGTETTQVAQRG